MLRYKTDLVQINDRLLRVPPPTDLLENLLDHRSDPHGVPLLSPLRNARGFTGVLQAVREAPDPVPIPAGWTRTEGCGASARRVIRGIDVEAVSYTQRQSSRCSPNWGCPGRSPAPPAVSGPERARHTPVGLESGFRTRLVR